MAAQAKPSEVIYDIGLSVVVSHNNPILDIVFVHGLTGHPERTWTFRNRQPKDGNDDVREPQPRTKQLNLSSTAHQSTVYWPRDLLPTTIPDARVLTYGYDTHITQQVGQPVTYNSVQDIARDFLVALEAGRREEPARPLLFVAHSLGGIVVKELLRRSSGCHQGQSHLRRIFESTAGIVFFGTPHRGSDQRGILQHAVDLLTNVMGLKVNEQIANALLPSSENLRELGYEFTRMAYEHRWTIHSFQETLGVQVLNGRKVVEDASSYLNFAIETAEHIKQDHLNMCRFAGPQDVGYRKVAFALRRIVDSLFANRVLHPTIPLTVKQRKQMCDSLLFDEIGARLWQIGPVHPGTCRWLETNDKYLEWLNPSKIPEHHGLLWVKGKPGSGKSTLMKFALEQSQRTMKSRVILSFFFNARGMELEKSAVGMYRTLLWQLLDRIPGLAAIFDSSGLGVRWPQDGQMQWGVKLLKELFAQAIQSLGQSQVVCFIDALDECRDDQIRDVVSFFEHISELAIASNTHFQVCFSSRHYPHISTARGLELVLEELEDHYQDIANYIDSKLRVEPSRLTSKIRAELQTRASGVFLWAVFVVEMLNRQYERGYLTLYIANKCLQQCPRDLHSWVKDIICRDNQDQNKLILCVQWVLFAKMPLRPEELYFAVLAGTNAESLRPWDQKLVTRADIQEFIVDCSKGLLEITKSRDPVVRFIHESARDFILEEGGRTRIWPDLDDRFPGQSHGRLKECCLKYICADIAGTLQFPERLPKAWTDDAADLRDLAQQSFPFLNYAVRNVLYHADQAESKGISQNNLQIFPLKTWINLNNLLEKHETHRHMPEASLLDIFVKDNLYSLFKAYLYTFRSPETTKDGNPVSAALTTRNTDEVQPITGLELQKSMEKALEPENPDTFTSVSKPDSVLSSHDDTDLKSVFSKLSSSQTGASLNEQLDGATLLMDFLFHNENLNPLYVQASTKVTSTKLQTHLRGFFRNYGEDLKQEAENKTERLAAKFASKYAGYVAQRIRDALTTNEPEGSGITWQGVPTETAEQRIETWLIKAGFARERQVQEPFTQETRESQPNVKDTGFLEPVDDEDIHEDIHDDSGGEEEEVRPGADDPRTPSEVLEEMRQFLLSAEAFQTLKRSLRRWLKLDETKDADTILEEVEERVSHTGKDMHGGLELTREGTGEVTQQKEVTEPTAPGVMTIDPDMAHKDQSTKSQSRESSPPPVDTRGEPEMMAHDGFRQDSDIESTDEEKVAAAEEVEEFRFPHTLPKLIDRIFDMLPLPVSEPPVPPGKTRIRWKCQCGQELFDDFVEVKPGSLQALQSRLQELNGVENSGHQQHNALQQCYQTMSDCLNALRLWIRQGVNRAATTGNSGGNSAPSSRRDDIEAQQVCENDPEQSQQGCNRDQKHLHLLMCIDKGKHWTQLHQKRLQGISDDCKLFQFLREQYFEHRNFTSWFTLRSVKALSLARFKVDANWFAGVHSHGHACTQEKCVCLPPIEKVNREEYRCSPAPKVEPEYFPALGSDELTHYFLKPHTFREPQRIIYHQLPKRACGELRASPEEAQLGWGIHFEEGWHWRTVYFVCVFFNHRRHSFRDHLVVRNRGHSKRIRNCGLNCVHGAHDTWIYCNSGFAMKCLH